MPYVLMMKPGHVLRLQWLEEVPGGHWTDQDGFECLVCPETGSITLRGQIKGWQEVELIFKDGELSTTRGIS